MQYSHHIGPTRPDSYKMGQNRVKVGPGQNGPDCSILTSLDIPSQMSIHVSTYHYASYKYDV